MSRADRPLAIGEQNTGDAQARVASQRGASAAAAPLCPVVDGRRFEPLDPRHAGDPYPWLLQAQREQPTFYMPAYDMWCVTRFEDVEWVVRDTEKFSSRSVVANDLHPDLIDLFPAGHPLVRALVNSDPPAHTRLRKALQPAFTPKAVAGYEPMIRGLADALIDGFESTGRCELVNDYTKRLTLRSVTQMCGLPLEDATEFASFNLAQLTESRGTITAPHRRAEAERTRRFVDHLKGLIDKRRTNPEADLISYVAAVEPKVGPPLSKDEMVGLLFNILAASLDNTSNGISLMFHEVLRRRGLWQEICDGSRDVTRVIEETLRWHDPAQAVVRITTQPVTVAGQKIPESATIFAHYGAAQRDPSVFAAPNAFDPDRADLSRHFAMGRGAHMCLGAPVARLEMQISLERFSERIPDLRLVTDEELVWNAGAVGAGVPARIKELQVKWRPSTSTGR